MNAVNALLSTRRELTVAACLLIGAIGGAWIGCCAAIITPIAAWAHHRCGGVSEGTECRCQLMSVR